MPTPEPTRPAESTPVDPAVAAIDRMVTAISYGRDSRDVHRYARESAGLDLDVPAYTLLVRVDAGGSSRISALAEALGLDLSTVSRKVAKLEEQGLLQRASDPLDARAVLVDLTEVGATAVHRLREARRARITEAIAHWTPADRDQLGALVDRLLDEFVAAKQREESAATDDPTPPSTVTTDPATGAVAPGGPA